MSPGTIPRTPTPGTRPGKCAHCLSQPLPTTADAPAKLTRNRRNPGAARIQAWRCGREDAGLSERGSSSRLEDSPRTHQGTPATPRHRQPPDRAAAHWALSLTLANTLYVPGDFNPLHGSSMYPFLLMFLLPFSKKSQPPLYLADFLPIPST